VNKARMITKPIKSVDLMYFDFYQEINDHWQRKARRLQSRRWRQLKRWDKAGQNEFNDQ